VTLSSIQPPHIRFSGYRRTKAGTAELYLPGHTNARDVQAEIVRSCGKEPGALRKVSETLPMERRGDYWVLQTQVPLGSAYRFRVNDKDRIEARFTDSNDSGASYTDFRKDPNGAYWQPDDPPPVGAVVTYRIPIADNPRFRVEKHVPGKPPEPIPVFKDGADWVFTTAPAKGDPEDTTYRLAPALDMQEVVQHNKLGPFNLIANPGVETPQKSSVIADIYLDSLVTAKQIDHFDRQARQSQNLPERQDGDIPLLPMRDHFRQFAAKPSNQQEKPEQGLLDLLAPRQEQGGLSRLQQAGFSALLFKPFIGGDNISSHRYWTIDPYVLNNSFQSKASFRTALTQMMGNGMKVYADGAFVNQGLNGVHVMSNLAHGFNSPYWRWLKYGDESQPGGPQLYPGMAYQKYVFGILPTSQNPKTGQRSVNYDHFAFRVINDPSPRNKQYDSKRPTFIELYDPRIEDAQGRPILDASTKLMGSQDSVQKLRFPITPQELMEKRKALAQEYPAGSSDQTTRKLAEKKLFCNWQNFRLDKPSADDSAVKWDGQADVAIMNTKNQDVVNYLDKAVGYWSRMVMNTQTAEVAKKLAQAKGALDTDDPAALLDTITKKPPREREHFFWHEDEDDADPFQDLQVLPPITNRKVEEIDKAEAEKIMNNLPSGCKPEDIGEKFTNRLLSEVPFDVLPLPTLFKANLCYPAFQHALQQTPRSSLSKFIDKRILQPLSWLPVVGTLFNAIRTFFFPPKFEKQLANKMDDIFNQLKLDSRDKLRHPGIQSLLADKLGERIYLSLLTGQDLHTVSKLETNPQALEDAFYKGMPGHLLKADPVTAARLLPPFLIERLNKLKPVQVANAVEEELRLLDPKLVALAEEVVKRREFGLNWRIDAAKDVADMDRIRNAEPSARPGLFQEEVQSIKKFWDQLTQSMRKPFPKASVIAELTDFEMLTNYDQKAARDARAKLLKGQTFTSLPNLTYVYSPLLQLIGYAQRPDEYGDTQLTLGNFLSKIQTMSEEVPVSALQQYQNLTASHDYPTTSHALLINPDLFNMDLLKWWGLKDDFGVAVDELQSKACFDGLRQDLERLGIENLPDVLNTLKDIVSNPALFTHPNSKFGPLTRKFYDEHSKRAESSTYRPTPHELKGRFVDELFQTVRPGDLGLENQEQMNALHKALKARMEEPSEAKAMRGAIVNAALQGWGYGQGQPALWQALDKTTQQWGRHFGYQPLDIALNHVFEKLDMEQLPPNMRQPERLEEWKSDLYRQATQPVMDKLLKVFAVQNALPGNPSVYLPDLFAQGGSEWTKNIFTQNRNLIRVDKLQDRGFERFLEEVGAIFGTRSNPDLQVLNDGTVLPVTPDDQNGVLPIVRDNGKQQAIVLVNTGTPRPLDWNHKAGTEEHYETAERTLHNNELYDYKPDLSELDLPAGMLYEDVHTQERFRINEQGKLVSARNPDYGMDLRQFRILRRLPQGE
jgi:hypothetical protein